MIHYVLFVQSVRGGHCQGLNQFGALSGHEKLGASVTETSIPSICMEYCNNATCTNSAEDVKISTKSPPGTGKCVFCLDGPIFIRSPLEGKASRQLRPPHMVQCPEKFRTRYSGHLLSRLMQNRTQHGQTMHFGTSKAKNTISYDF